MTALLETAVTGLPPSTSRGKVREVYDLGPNWGAYPGHGATDAWEWYQMNDGIAFDPDNVDPTFIVGNGKLTSTSFYSYLVRFENGMESAMN